MLLNVCEGKLLITILKLAAVFNTLQNSDSQERLAFPHGNSARRAGACLALLTHKMAVGTNWDRATARYFKAYRTLNFVSSFAQYLILLDHFYL